MPNVLTNRSDYTITLRQNAPITVKNQIKEIRGVDDFENVDASLKQNGATFVYNANTSKYEVKLADSVPVLFANTANNFNGIIDCGAY